VRPVNAPIPVEVLDTDKGIDISVAESDASEKIAYSVGEYAKQAVSLVKNVMARGECGKGDS
jgi:hypothetical protein